MTHNKELRITHPYYTPVSPLRYPRVKGLHDKRVLAPLRDEIIWHWTVGDKSCDQIAELTSTKIGKVISVILKYEDGVAGECYHYSRRSGGLNAKSDKRDSAQV